MQQSTVHGAVFAKPPSTPTPEAVRRLLLSECAADLIRQWLHQVRHDRAVTRIDESLDRHTGHEFNFAKAGNLICRHCDPDRIIALAGALIRRDVR